MTHCYEVKVTDSMGTDYWLQKEVSVDAPAFETGLALECSLRSVFPAGVEAHYTGSF